MIVALACSMDELKLIVRGDTAALLKKTLSAGVGSEFERQQLGSAMLSLHEADGGEKKESAASKGAENRLLVDNNDKTIDRLRIDFFNTLFSPLIAIQ